MYVWMGLVENQVNGLSPVACLTEAVPGFCIDSELDLGKTVFHPEGLTLSSAADHEGLPVGRR